MSMHSRVKLEFRNVAFWGEGKTGVPREKSRGAEPTTNSTHIWHRVQESSREASALTTAPSKLPSNVIITDVWGKQTPILAETPSWKHVYILTIKLVITCDNFVASLTKLVSSRPRDSPETFQLGKVAGNLAQSPVRCPTSLPSRKVSDESFGRYETSFVRIATKLSQETCLP